jgi:hypothetical protein
MKIDTRPLERRMNFFEDSISIRHDRCRHCDRPPPDCRTGDYIGNGNAMSPHVAKSLMIQVDQYSKALRPPAMKPAG